ncbi:MAG: DnaB-like helicase C-terminal domain-containing protein [bacterium]
MNTLSTADFLKDFTGSVFQTFHDRKEDYLAGEKDQCTCKLSPQCTRVHLTYNDQLFKKLNAGNIGIYFTPNFFTGGRKIENLIKLNSVFGDLDVAKEGDGQIPQQVKDKKTVLWVALMKLDLKPNFIIVTKNGLQPLWLIEESITDEDTQKQFISVVQGVTEWSKGYGAAGDKVKDIPRVLRLAGYNHCKGGPFEIKAYKFHEDKYTLQDLAKLFPYFDYEVIKADNAKTKDLNDPLKDIDIKDVVIRAYKEIGEQDAYFDRSGRIVLSRGVTGAFQGKNDDRQYIASTSGTEPAGNKVTFVSKLFDWGDYKRAFKWIVEQFNVQLGLSTSSLPVEVKPEEIEIPTLNSESLVTSILNPIPVESFGYTSFDEVLDGITPDFTYLLAAKSGNCKSALVLNILYNLAKRGVPSVFFDLENGSKLGDRRLLQIHTSWSKEILKTFAGDESKKDLLNEKVKELNQLPLSIFYGHDKLFAKGLLYQNIISAIRQVVKTKKAKVVAVDNLRNLDLQGLDENTFLSQVVTAFNKVASELNISIIMVHHISIKDDNKALSIEDFNSAEGYKVTVPHISRTMGTSDVVNKVFAAFSIALDPYYKKLYVWVQKNRDGESDKRFTLNICPANLCITDPPERREPILEFKDAMTEAEKLARWYREKSQEKTDTSDISDDELDEPLPF